MRNFLRDHYSKNPLLGNLFSFLFGLSVGLLVVARKAGLILILTTGLLYFAPYIAQRVRELIEKRKESQYIDLSKEKEQSITNR